MSYSSKADQLESQKLKVLSELRKIAPTDTFPCYSCFDEDEARATCKVCYGSGYLTGDNPMVMFIDDFLNQNLP